MLRLLLIGLALCTAPRRLEGEPYAWTDKTLGVSITLPDKTWQLSDRSQGLAKVLIFSPSQDVGTRCTVLYLPAAILPEGLLSREGQIKAALGDRYKRVAYETDTLGGKEAQRLEYAAAGTTTLEYGLRRDDFYLVFQLSAPDAGWKNAKIKAILEQIEQSFTFTGEASLATAEADLSTPDEVRARRKSSKAGPPEFEISQHDLQVRIDPPQHTLKVIDRITVRAVKEGLSEIDLRYSKRTRPPFTIDPGCAGPGSFRSASPWRSTSWWRANPISACLSPSTATPARRSSSGSDWTWPCSVRACSRR
jgi:hypothetical protein